MEAALESQKFEIKELNKVIDACDAQQKKWFVIIDKTGIVETFMKYQGPNIWKAAPGEVTAENISRKFLASAQFGQWLVLNFGDIEHDYAHEPIFGTELVPWNFFDMEWVFKYPNIEEFRAKHFPDFLPQSDKLSTKDSFKVMLLGSKNVFPTEVLKRSHFLECVSAEEKAAWLEEQEKKKEAEEKAKLAKKVEEEKKEAPKQSTTGAKTTTTTKAGTTPTKTGTTTATKGATTSKTTTTTKTTTTAKPTTSTAKTTTTTSKTTPTKK